MGCLFAMIGGLAPRFGFFVYWILRPNAVDTAFSTFIFPLIGILFLPYATLLYVVLYTPGVGLSGWEWFWVILAGCFDVAQSATAAASRKQLAPSYSGGSSV